MNQFKRLTIPSVAKESTLRNDGLFSKARLASQDVKEDQITLDPSVMPYENSWAGQNVSDYLLEDQITLDVPAIPYQNHQTHQKKHTNTLEAFLPGTIPFTPRPAQSNGHTGSQQAGAFLTIPFTPRPMQTNEHNGYAGSKSAVVRPVTAPFVPDPQINAIISAVFERETNQVLWEAQAVPDTLSKSKASSKWAFFLELPHLLVYMIGALAIAGLYLIIPLLNLLNATIPGNLNTVLIALGIIVPGELLVCLILAKTIPRGKVKKGSVIAQP